jgi:hypothetical protein
LLTVKKRTQEREVVGLFFLSGSWTCMYNFIHIGILHIIYIMAQEFVHWLKSQASSLLLGDKRIDEADTEGILLDQGQQRLENALGTTLSL